MIPGNPAGDFDNTLATVIERFEGWSPTAYFVNGDVPTIGYGVAFVYKVDDTHYAARTLEELNDWFNGIHTFTQAERDVLVEIADELEDGDEAAALQLFNGWGPAATLSLTEAQGELVLGRAAADIAANAIPQSIRTDLAGTKELAVLESLAYNSPGLVGKHLETAIINDDRASAWYEIRYQSNGGDPEFQNGIAKRRYAESQLFGLYDDSKNVTETDSRETFRMFTVHEDTIRTYDGNYNVPNNDRIAAANSDYGLTGNDAVQTRLEAFAAAKGKLAGLYVAPFGHTAADIDEVYVDSDLDSIDRTLSNKPAGRDLIFGEGGGDTIHAGTMNDIVYGDFGSIALDMAGGAGNDTLYGDAGNDTLVGGAGDDILEGGVDGDLLIGDSNGAHSESSDGKDTLNGGDGADTLQGGGGDDSLDGGAEADVLYGGLLNDLPDSPGGYDTLNGGAGNDQLNGGTGSDSLLGGDGADTLTGGTELDYWTAYDELFGGAGTDHFVCWGGETIMDAESDETLTVNGLTVSGGTWQFWGKEFLGGESGWYDHYGWVGQHGELYEPGFADIDGDFVPYVNIWFHDKVAEDSNDWDVLHVVTIMGWDGDGFMGITLIGDRWSSSALSLEDVLDSGASADGVALAGSAPVMSAPEAVAGLMPPAPSVPQLQPMIADG